MKTPLERTIGELAVLVESIRADCATTATVLLVTHPPEAEVIADLAKLDEALAKAHEAVANVCSALWVKEHLRERRAQGTASGTSS